MSLKDQISDDMKSAMKAGDKDRLKVVCMMMAAIKQVEVDSRSELDDNGVLGVLEKMVKQRRESLEQYQAAGRDDLTTLVAAVEAAGLAKVPANAAAAHRFDNGTAGRYAPAPTPPSCSWRAPSCC